MNRIRAIWKPAVIACLVLLAVGLLLKDHTLQKSVQENPQDVALSTIASVERSIIANIDPTPEPEPSSPKPKSMQDWVKEYGQLPLADAHNHGSVLGIGDNL